MDIHVCNRIYWYTFLRGHTRAYAFTSWVLGNHTGDRFLSVIQQFLAAVIGKTNCNCPHAPSWTLASTERQPFLVMRHWKSHCRLVVLSHKVIFRRLYRQRRLQYTPGPIMEMGVNGASLIVGHVSWVIWRATGCTLSLLDHWLPV